MKRAKTLKYDFSILFVVTVILLLSTVTLCACLVGCADKTDGTLYLLREAYENGFVDKEDIASVAYYHNNSVAYPDKLSVETEKAVKESAAKRLRGGENPITAATADGIKVEKYYGTYGDCCAVIIRDEYLMPPTDVPFYKEEIGGVEICYTGYDIIEIWRSN